MKIEDIRTLSLNSYFGSRVLAYFLSGCRENRIKFEIIFVVLPIIFQSSARTVLSTANKSSTLQSILLGRLEGKIALSNIDVKIDFLKSLTQKSLVVGANNFDILVQEFISIGSPLNYNDEPERYCREYYKAAYYLGHILSNSSYLDTLLKLQIRQL